MTAKSSNSIVKKLGIKDSSKICFIGIPKELVKSVKLPRSVKVAKNLSGSLDYIHLFATSGLKLEKDLYNARRFLKMNGALWISWPKKDSGVESDLSENIIRALGLNFGLVDVKVVSIDDTWSALKFVYRLKDRK
jgi:hypothetical protein